MADGGLAGALQSCDGDTFSLQTTCTTSSSRCRPSAPRLIPPWTKCAEGTLGLCKVADTANLGGFLSTSSDAP